MSKLSHKSLIIFGKHSCLSAVRTQNIEKILVTAQFMQTYGNYLNRYSNICTLTTRKELSLLLGKEATHQGIAMYIEYQSPSLNSVLQNVQDRSLIIVLDEVSDIKNIGAILRTANVFNASCLIVPKRFSMAHLAKIGKTASGAFFSTPIVPVTNISRTLNILQKDGYMCYGMDGDHGKDIRNIEFLDKSVLILGSEVKGMKRLTLETCDQLVKIPMKLSENHDIDSLNVGQAAAIAAYVFATQKFL